MSERIGETIALSKLREKELMDRGQETNLPSNDSKGRKRNLKDTSRRSTKSDSFLQKQISFYGEASPKSSSKTLRDDSQEANTSKNVDALAQTKKTPEDESDILEENQNIDRDTYLCPCSEIHKKGDTTTCTCTKGICLKPEEIDLKKIEEFFEQLPQTKESKLKCFAKALVKIKHIMKMNLDQATADQQIMDVLTGLGPCECEGESCECQLHHLDLDAKYDDYNFMAATILQKFNSMLDEKLQDKLGIKLKERSQLRNRSVKTDSFIETTRSEPEKSKCNVCKEKYCTCVTK